MKTMLEQLLELANRQPWRPFTVRLADGSDCPVREPAAIGVNRTSACWFAPDGRVVRLNPELLAALVEEA